MVGVTRYSVESVLELVDGVVRDLSAVGQDWSPVEHPADGPVFGTEGMWSVTLVDSNGDDGPRVWVEDDRTLRLTWRTSSTEWFGSPRTDAILADLLFALCSDQFEDRGKGRLLVPRRGGGRPRRVVL
jgi:hypothetical protein